VRCSLTAHSGMTGTTEYVSLNAAFSSKESSSDEELTASESLSAAFSSKESSSDEELTASEIQELDEMILTPSPSSDIDALERYRHAHETRSYGGDFPWTGATFTLEVHKGRRGPSLIQWLTRLTSNFWLGGSVIFAADGRFRRPSDSALLFPIWNIDLRWRYDQSCSRIVIDFFDKNELMPWRFDELRPDPLSSNIVSDLTGVGHVGKHVFTYTMRSAVGGGRAIDEFEKCTTLLD